MSTESRVAQSLNILPGTPVISIKWLGGVEILVIHTLDQLEFLLNNNKAVLYLDIIEDLEDIWVNSMGAASQIRVNDNLFHILLFPKCETKVVVHECVHMIDAILDSRGIPISLDNTETRAYLTDWLYTTIEALILDTNVCYEDFIDYV